MDPRPRLRPLYAPELLLLFRVHGTDQISGPFHDFQLHRGRQDRGDTISQIDKKEHRPLDTFSLVAPIVNDELALLCEHERVAKHRLSREHVDFALRYAGMLGTSGRFLHHTDEQSYLWDPHTSVLVATHQDGSRVRVYDLTTVPFVVDPTIEQLYLRNLHHHAHAVALEGKRHGIELAHSFEHKDGHITDYDYTRISRILEPREQLLIREAHDVHAQARLLADAMTPVTPLSIHVATRLILLAQDDLVSTPTLIGLAASDCPIIPYIEDLERSQHHLRRVRAHPLALDALTYDIRNNPGFFPALATLTNHETTNMHTSLKAGTLEIQDVLDLAAHKSPTPLKEAIERACAYRDAAAELEKETAGLSR